jgi:hypothetical protein
MFAAKNAFLTKRRVASAPVIVDAIATQATSGAFASHVADDILMVLAYRRGSATLPSKPSAAGTVPAFNDMTPTSGSTNNSARLVWYRATATNHTSGTWTNATYVMTVVLRGALASGSPIGGFAQATGTLSATVQFPSITLSNSTGSSAILHIGGWEFSTNAGGWSAAPAGYTQVEAAVNNAIAGPGGVVLLSKDVTTTDGSVNQANSSGSSRDYAGFSVEILAA